MSEIVRTWLERQLGVIFELDKWNEDVGGIILARLLNRYELVTEDQLNILECEGEHYESILEFMRQTINGLGITLTREDYQHVLQGKGSAATKLFYELYLTLHDKDKMHYIANKKMTQLNQHPDQKYIIEEVSATGESFKKFDNELAQPIKSNMEVVEWYRNRFKKLMDHCKKTRKEYQDFIENNRMVVGKNAKTFADSKAAETLPTECSSADMSLDDLLALEKRAHEMEVIKPDPTVSKKIISNIKQKVRKEEGRRELKAHFQRVLMHDLWDKMIKEQEDYFKDEFTKTLLKQSLYEQQMTTALLSVRQQRNIMAENRHKMMAYIQAEKEERIASKLMKDSREYEHEKFHYYKEREHKLELHRRLFSKQTQRKGDASYKLCLQALEDIFDLAMYTSTYQDYHCGEMSRRKRNDLANLFIKSQPIFTNVTNVASILDYNRKVVDDVKEKIYIAEIERQNAMDDLAYEEYANFQWPWDYECWFENDTEFMKCGLNILGFIVQRLLHAKYPARPLPPPPNIPRATVCVCVNGIQEQRVIPMLSHLLQGRKIKVIEMQDAINYCLKIFKTESTYEYEATALIKESEMAFSGSRSTDTFKPKKGAKLLKNKKASGSTESSAHNLPRFQHKQAQTPRLFPCEEIVFSKAGDLGRTAFEVLNLGEPLTPYLMSDIFVEYLKSLKDVEGWALINYPQTFQQAVILEEALTAVRVPIFEVEKQDSVSDLFDIRARPTEHEKVDAFTAKRKSNLLATPKVIEEKVYDTYLTAYIEVKSEHEENMDEIYYNYFKSTDSESHLNKFYQDQGCKYTLLYKTMDFQTVKHLGKLILGDYSIPPKTSMQIFTETLKYTEAEWGSAAAPTNRSSKSLKIGEKVKSRVRTPLSSTKSKEERRKSEDRKGKATILIVHEDKETQIPEVVPSSNEIFVEEEPAEAEPRPGDVNWLYVDLEVPREFENAMAILWENMEETYINDMKQLFFRRRTLLDSLLPYNTFVTNSMKEYMHRPDNKQDYLHSFQLTYNELDDDMREDDEVKAELHCRVHEFREKLWKICDDRMVENEIERKEIIAENWLTNLLFSLTNIFINFMQIEIDRCSDSLQLLMDYYMSMITQQASERAPLEKIKLNLIQLPLNNEDQDHLQAYHDYITNIMKNCIDPNYQECPFHKFGIMNLTLCMQQINSFKNSCYLFVDRIIECFSPPRHTKSSTTKQPHIQPPPPDVCDRASDIMQEYGAAYESELMRCELRVSSIQRVLNQEIEMCIDRSAQMYTQMYNEINDRYHSEINSINDACSLLCRAIEAESKIQPEMLLMDDKFYIKLNTLLYEGPLPTDLSELKEPLEDDRLSPTQLNKIIGIFTKISPSGQLPERVFTFLLQDMLVFKADDGENPLVPKLWKAMHPHQTHRFVDDIFGNTEFVDWKDFIIYNLDVRFPTEAELIQARIDFKKFDEESSEFVMEHQYTQVILWFESEKAPHMVTKIKEILKRLFSIDENRINYTRLLLAFCKDHSAIIGFAKALELSLGRLVCWDQHRGNMHFQSLMQTHLSKQVSILAGQVDRKDTELMAEEIIQDLIDQTVHQSTSAVLTDSFSSELTEMHLHTMDTFRSEFEMVFKRLEEDSSTGENVTVDDPGYSQRTSMPSIFTNPSQGYDSAKDNVVYNLPFEVLMVVLHAAMPWIAKLQSFGGCSCRERIALIYNSHITDLCKEPLIYQFLHDPHFQDVLDTFYKFVIKDPVEIMKKYI